MTVKLAVVGKRRRNIMHLLRGTKTHIYVPEQIECVAIKIPKQHQSNKGLKQNLNNQVFLKLSHKKWMHVQLKQPKLMYVKWFMIHSWKMKRGYKLSQKRSQLHRLESWSLAHMLKKSCMTTMGFQPSMILSYCPT